MFFSNFRLILGPPGPYFSILFLDANFDLFFDFFFLTNFRNVKKVQSAQNTAPVHGFEGSPGLKKNAML